MENILDRDTASKIYSAPRKSAWLYNLPWNSNNLRFAQYNNIIGNEYYIVFLLMPSII